MNDRLKNHDFLKNWRYISDLILKNRFLFLIIILLVSIFSSTQFKNIRFTFTEANLLPDSHIQNLIYNKFTNLFGEEGNLIVIGLNDSLIFSRENFRKWTTLNKEIEKFDEIDYTLSIGNLKSLKKNDDEEKFDLIPIKFNSINNEKLSIEKSLENFPFYEDLIYKKESLVIRSAIFMKKKIVNTNLRKEFILDKLIPIIEKFENETKINVRLSGMPYIRTLNAQNIIDEMGFFVFAAILVTSIIFYFFLRSIKGTIISIIVVLLGVIWSLGTLGFLQYEITVLTALIPPLIIVIGVPNCIFLINKFKQEIIKNNDKIKSLKNVIIKIGNASLLANFTTALGFATFIFTDSKILKEFGIVASINILGIFFISIILIPIFFSLLKKPEMSELKYLTGKKTIYITNLIEKIIKSKRKLTFTVASFLFAISLIGISNLKISGNMLDDIPKGKEFFKDLSFFNDEFSGVTPIEILIDTKRKNGVTNYNNLKKIEKLDKSLNELTEISKPLSIINVIKFLKQSYYNGNPNFYTFPSRQENLFISKYIKNSESKIDFIKNYVDENNQNARITTYMKNIDSQKIEYKIDEIKKIVSKIFPEDKFDVNVTGKAILFLHGTKFLVKNLFLSLFIAIIIIALIISYIFKSIKMVLISLIPNILPLIITAGFMGFFQISLKPSTILVFSIAFGISVDNTIHFLAKFRQEIFESNCNVSKSVYITIKERGIGMFYTSVILLFGFSVFMMSDFGGTVALGGLVSLTLLFSMFSNLILLPSIIIYQKNNLIKNLKRLVN